MVKAGYEVILYVLCNDDINININRVQQRVIEGGHDIAVEIIRHRYKMAHTYLKDKLHLFTESYFIDNSTDEAIIKAQIKQGVLKEFDNQNTVWVSNILSLYKRIKR